MTHRKRTNGLMTGLLFLLILATVGRVSAQAPVVSARIDSSSVLIGDPFHLDLEVRTSPSVKIIWPSLPDTFNHFQLLTRGKIDTLSTPGGTLYRQRITLTSFDSGMWVIPGIRFPVPSTDTSSWPSTDSLVEQVNTVPVDTTRPFKPIHTIRQVPFDLLDYLPYILAGALFVLLLVGLILWLGKRKKPAGPPPPPPPREKPYETALKALYQLQGEKLWQKGEMKPYYVRLTDILRVYLENQFSIPAMELTSEELMDNIRKVTVVSQQQETLRDILATADLVKFAKMQPGPEDHSRCMQQAIELVEWTRPKPKPEEQAGSLSTARP